MTHTTAVDWTRKVKTAETKNINHRESRAQAMEPSNQDFCANGAAASLSRTSSSIMSAPPKMAVAARRTEPARDPMMAMPASPRT